ncbi:MAG: putative lipid II flippase FtsW [Blastocatellia bacterium]|nr:putative lipid II flippase FtsW [Blastocatellia bacterium]MCS7157034.1 putative lipid II flippase FtsW [Blastocatellia bacterium]MCX7752235.1 putative lipid II flippase FtsW [Blastocatellia bacterium]MDW8167726.1 putative lipid II flippase FtsW [Acidobacteriota bacterium]MDW8256326.1 putative lipid II flippase FtsW [Acidobacteriota bacterium]
MLRGRTQRRTSWRAPHDLALRWGEAEHTPHREMARIGDKVLFTLAIALALLGVVMVYSASAVLAAERYGTQYHFLARQAVWVMLALAVMVVTMRVDYHLYQHPRLVALLVGGAFLLLVAVFFFPAVNGAHRWIRWGSLSFQPSELARFALIVFLAAHLDRRIPAGIKRFRLTFLPCALVTGAMMVLILLEPDLGMAFSLGLILLVMFFIVRVPFRHQVALGIGALPMLAWLTIHVDWRWERILAYLDPWQDPRGSGFQAIQSLIALGSGGITGVGFAQGKQKLFFLPEPHTDFIFAHIGEELGLMGTGLLVVAFGVFLWRGMRIAWHAPDTFGTLLGAGIVTAILMQALFHMSVAVGLFPVKGTPLPLISYGGSSLVITMAEIGVLLNIAQQARPDDV